MGQKETNKYPWSLAPVVMVGPYQCFAVDQAAIISHVNIILRNT